MTKIFGDKVNITTEDTGDILRGHGDLQQGIKVLLEKIETHLSYITDEQVKEEDTNAYD